VVSNFTSGNYSSDGEEVMDEGCAIAKLLKSHG
jgi:hypothetical protein